MTSVCSNSTQIFSRHCLVRLHGRSVRARLTVVSSMLIRCTLDSWPKPNFTDTDTDTGLLVCSQKAKIQNKHETQVKYSAKKVWQQ